MTCRYCNRDEWVKTASGKIVCRGCGASAGAADTRYDPVTRDVKCFHCGAVNVVKDYYAKVNGTICYNCGLHIIDWGKMETQKPKKRFLFW